MISRLLGGCLDRACHHLDRLLSAPTSWLWQDAAPPRLAAHVLAEAIGLDRDAALEDIAHYYEESGRTIAAIHTA